MAVFKCKMCGGSLDVAEGLTVRECDYCGEKQTVPRALDESMQNLFNRANTLRMKGEFDKAESIYEKIIRIDSKQSEAYWGLILCKYGIEYVDDPMTFKKIPTCHRASYESIIADEDYKSALENADLSQRILYEEQAKEIDRIQKEILALAQKEETYDVFICYKETDANGQRTQDSVIANDIYYQLTNEGYKVFYAAITLEGKLGSAYEPIIFAALNSAKVMLVIGTNPEYFNAVWVKNEWSRFLKIIQKDRSKLLIPCYRDMDAYELPEEFAHLQAQDMAKIGFINDIVRGIKKVVSKTETAIPVTFAKKVKYCVACLNECSEGAKFCQACGKSEFADTKKEAELMSELAKLRNQAEKAEELKRQQEAEAERKRKAEEQKRLEEQRKKEEENRKNNSISVGQYIKFGSYEQDNNIYNGKEPIEWKVLEVKDGKALLISKYALDCKPYNTTLTYVTWETCSLRKWLNNDFINSAFNANEKGKISTVTVSADKNYYRCTDEGNSTQDKVFLLSIPEAAKYFSSNWERQCKPTKYAIANKVYANTETGNCVWWLRSPGYDQDYAACVNLAGRVDMGGGYVSGGNEAIRPALWIQL